MSHNLEGSCNTNVLNWKLYRKINSIRIWSSRKVEFLSEITSSLPLKFEYSNYLFPIQRFSCTFHDPLQSISCKFFAKIMRGIFVFCCSSFIIFNPSSHLKNLVCFEWIFFQFPTKHSMCIPRWNDVESTELFSVSL